MAHGHMIFFSIITHEFGFGCSEVPSPYFCRAYWRWRLVVGSRHVARPSPASGDGRAPHTTYGHGHRVPRITIPVDVAVCHHRRLAWLLSCGHGPRRPAQVSNKAKCLERACSFDNSARLATHVSSGASRPPYISTKPSRKGRRRRQGSSRVAVARKGSSHNPSASKTPDLGHCPCNARVRLPPLCQWTKHE